MAKKIKFKPAARRVHRHAPRAAAPLASLAAQADGSASAAGSAPSESDASVLGAQGSEELAGQAGQVEHVEATPFEPTPEGQAMVDAFLAQAKGLAATGGKFHFYMDFSMFGLPDDDLAVKRLGRRAFASLCSESDPSRAAGVAVPVASLGEAWSFLDSLMTRVAGSFPSADDVKPVPVTSRVRARWAERGFTRLLHPTPHGLRALEG